MKLNRKQLRHILLKEANLILEGVVDNSKLAKDVADVVFPEYTFMNNALQNDLIKRLEQYPDLAQELLQFLDTTAITGAVYSFDLLARKLNNILSKYMG